MGQYSKASSAKSLIVDTLRLSHMSFMYTKKRDGPSTEPWGTPDVTAKQLEDTPSTTTL